MRPNAHTWRDTNCLALFAGLALSTMVHGDETMQSWLDDTMATGDDLAVSIMVHTKGETEFLSGGLRTPGGPAIDADTQFQIGSVTKALTNLLLAELVETGAVDYGTPIGGLLPESFAPRNPAISDITLEELATHSSGLPSLPTNLNIRNPEDPYAGYDRKRLLAGLAAARELQPLGKRYAYSNFGVGLLGHLLGDVQGDGFGEALATVVTRPLGLDDTGMTLSENRADAFSGGDVVTAWSMTDALAGAGALWGTARDFEQLARVMLGESDDPLQRPLEKSLEIVASTADGFDLTRVWHVAYAGETPIFWHNGGTGGFHSFFGFRPDSRQAIAIFVSGDSDPTGIGLEWLGRTARAPDLPAIDASVLGEYALVPGFSIGIYEEDGQLLALASGQSPNGIYPIGSDWYALTDVDASLEFLREEGAVQALALVQGGRRQTAQRVSETFERAERAAIDLPAETLAEFVGEYPLTSAAKFVIRQTAGGLQAQLTGQPFFPIFAAGDDVFFYRVVDAELHFERDASGAVVALTLHQGAISQRAARSD